jgi:hypothetical protein
MLLIVSGTFCVLLKVAPLGTLATPKASLRNESVVRVNVWAKAEPPASAGNRNTAKRNRSGNFPFEAALLAEDVPRLSRS